jgi:hypothetical protein
VAAIFSLTHESARRGKAGEPSILDEGIAFGKRMVDKGMEFLLTAYGLDELDLGTGRQKVECEKVIGAGVKGGAYADTPAYKMEMQQCAEKYGRLLAMFSERERRDAESFIRQPKNLRLMLPGETDAAVVRFKVFTTIFRILPKWILWLALAMSPIALFLALPLFIALYQACADKMMFAKMFVIGGFSLAVLLVFFIFF